MEAYAGGVVEMRDHAHGERYDWVNVTAAVHEESIIMCGEVELQHVYVCHTLFHQSHLTLPSSQSSVSL